MFFKYNGYSLHLVLSHKRAAVSEEERKEKEEKDSYSDVTNFVAGDIGKQGFFFSSATKGIHDMVMKLLDDPTHKIDDDQDLLEALQEQNRFKGVNFVNAKWRNSIMNQKESEAKRVQYLQVSKSFLKQGVWEATVRDDNKDYAQCNSVEQVRDCARSRIREYCIQSFVYRRSCFLKLAYDLEIREKQMYETILYSCYQLLPDAMEKTEEEGRFFLRENIQTPPMTSWRRRKEKEKEKIKKGSQNKKKMAMGSRWSLWMAGGLPSSV